MTLFIGGPYDGEDLPIDPGSVRVLRLPPRDKLNELFFDPSATGEADWPFRYERDNSVAPPVFRLTGSRAHHD